MRIKDICDKDNKNSIFNLNHYIMKKKLTLLIVLVVFFLLNSCNTKVDNKELKPTSSSTEAIDLFEKARDNIAAAKDEEALDLLNQAIELDNGFALAYIYRILVDGSLNSYRTNVEKALENMDAVSPDEQMFLKIFKYSDENQGDQMKLCLDSIQKMFSEDVWINYILGTFDFNGSREERNHFLSKAIELDSNFIPAYIGLITDLTYAMELDEAKQYAEKYIAMRPGDADPYIKMGTIFRQQNELEKALEQYEKAAEIDPVESYVFLANCHVFLGNFEKANELFQKSYEAREESFYKRNALNNIAIASVFEGDKEKAIEGFEKVREFNIENSAVAAAVNNRFSQAFVSAMFGDFALADDFMLKAGKEAESQELTEIEKGNINEGIDLWTCYIECLKGNTDKASVLADNYMNTAREQNLEYKIKIANLFKGIVAVKKSEFEKAVELLSNAPEDYIVWYYLGIAYQELGQTEKAKEQFSKITTANLINLNLASVKKDAVERMKILSKS